MLKNYLLTSWRNIKNNKINTLLNVIGMALGIASCFIILLSVLYELSFDRFHEKGHRVYRIVMERKHPERTRYWGWNTPRVSEAMVKDFPEVISRARILTETGPTQIRYENYGRMEKNVIYTDPEFFEIFTIPIIKGDMKTFLTKPGTIIITKEAAQQYFGAQDPIGKVVTVRNTWEENVPHIVTGVICGLPSNSHFHYDFILPLAATEVIKFEWGSWYCFNYVLLQEGANWKDLEKKLPGMIDRYFPSLFEGGEAEYRQRLAEGHGYRYFLQPLYDIHLKSRIEHELEPVGNYTYVILFIIVTGFILVLACVNFINLSTAQSAHRAREVGVRKVLGSFKRQLIYQFLFESILVASLSMVLACLFALSAIPFFKSLIDLDVHVLSINYLLLIPVLLLFAILVGTTAGTYPAFFLSSFKPVTVLRSSVGKGMTRSRLRNVLVVFQFAVSIALISSTFLVEKQIDFLLSKNLGYDKENLLIIENAAALGSGFESFRSELKNEPTIIAVGGGAYPGVATHTFPVRARGVANAKSVNLYNIGGDYEYLDTLRIPVVAGRKFEKGESYNREDRKIMLNEHAIRALGYDDPVGKQIEAFGHGMTIIGVIKDFHFRSLHDDIAAFAFFPLNPDRNAPRYAVIRINTNQMDIAIPKIKEIWQRFTGGLEFQYSILEDTLSKWYNSEKRVRRISSAFSSLAVLIGCLGLLGLVAYTMESRSREIGIRKVLGATVSGLTVKFLFDFLKLVGFAFIFAVPVAYVLMDNWLKSFAYYIKPDRETFILAGLITVLIALFTVGFHVIRAALANPVDSIRHE
jgi:putative ABC transport system permease protein